MIFTCLYIFLTAFSALLRHYVGGSIPDSLLIFLSTLYAIIFFHAVNYRSIRHTYSKLLDCKKLYLLTCITILIVWVGSFLIPVYYTPTIQVLSFICLSGVFGSFFMYCKDKTTVNLLRFTLITLVMLFFYAICYSRYTLHSFIYLLFWTFITGASGYIYAVKSWQLNNAGLSSSQILATRFWLLLLVSAIAMFYQHSYHEINWHSISNTLAVSITSLIIPVYCSQKSIEYLVLS